MCDMLQETNSKVELFKTLRLQKYYLLDVCHVCLVEDSSVIKLIDN